MLIYRFYTRCQKPGEFIAKYVTDLKRLSEGCEIVDLNLQLRDCLVVGCRDQSIQRKLLSERELSFEKALQDATAKEMANKDVEDIQKDQQSGPDEVPVNKIQEKRNLSVQKSAQNTRQQQLQYSGFVGKIIVP